MTVLKGWGSFAIGLLVFGVLALGPLISRPAYAQVTGASLSGIVSDSSGAVVPGAKVSIKDTATGATRDVVASDAGFYTASNLQPGPYQVTVSATGFTTLVRSGLNLTVGAQPVLDVTLLVGQVSQQVEVTEEAAAVELTSSAISSQVLEGAIRELPLNGRDWTALATLEPGVNSTTMLQVSYTTNNSTQRATRGYGAAMSIAGGRPYTNNFRVDGITINDYNNAAPGNALGVSLGVDAIEEFTVVTNNYSAAYGRTQGGVLNAITRSGTNQFHGTAFEFLRNSALDARNFFDPPTIPAFRRNQFGASAGAPIIKDKTFFFVAYEGLKNLYGAVSLATVPSNATNGTLDPGTGSGPIAHFCTIPTGVTPNCLASSQPINAAIRPYLGLWGQVNFGLLGNGDTGYYRFIANQVIGANYGFVRIDHHFSSRDTLFASFVDDTSTYSQADALNDVVLPQSTANKRIVIAETHILGAGAVNSVRFGFNRVNDLGGSVPCAAGQPPQCGLSANNPLAANPSLGIFAGFDAPTITASGITTFPGGLNDGNVNWYRFNSYQGYDDFSVTKGKHSLQFGAGFEHNQTGRFYDIAAGGNFAYSSLTNLLINGAQTQFSLFLTPLSTPQGLDPTRDYRGNIFGFYIQDDYRMRKNLTVNLGVRYEPATVPTEALGRNATLPCVACPTVRTGNPIMQNSSLGNVAPRVGLAWDPFGNGKTSVRAGFGMYDITIQPAEFVAYQQISGPFSSYIRTNNVPAGNFGPASVALVYAASGGVGTGTQYMEQNPKRDYVMQWNLAIQRQITPSLTVMMAYVGSHGVHGEVINADEDYRLPTGVTSAGWLWPTPVVNATLRVNPNQHYSSVLTQTWNSTSMFHSMLAQVTQRMSHGFQIQGSFTWGRGVDDNDAGPYFSTYSNSLAEQFPFANNRARSDFNVKENLTVNGSWIAPKPNFSSHAMNVAVGGWVLQSIVTARTGTPFTVTISGDPLGLNSGTTADFPQYNPGASGCTPGGVNPGNVAHYVNLSCFSLPMSTPAISASCTAFNTPKAPIAGTCANLLGNAGRNLLTGPGLVNVDFSVIKNHQITERLNAQFRAEFFNLFNKPNFNYPSSTALYNASGAGIGGAGALTGTSTYARQIQFGLKLVW